MKVGHLELWLVGGEGFDKKIEQQNRTTVEIGLMDFTWFFIISLYLHSTMRSQGHTWTCTPAGVQFGGESTDVK